MRITYMACMNKLLTTKTTARLSKYVVGNDMQTARDRTEIHYHVSERTRGGILSVIHVVYTRIFVLTTRHFSPIGPPSVVTKHTN